MCLVVKRQKGQELASKVFFFLFLVFYFINLFIQFTDDVIIKGSRVGVFEATGHHEKYILKMALLSNVDLS